MTKHGELIFDYLYRLYRSPKEARGLYEDNFGRRVQSTQVEDEIEKLLVEADADGKPTVHTNISVPAHLLIAIALRPRGRGLGRKRQQKPVWARRQFDLLVRHANTNYEKRFIAGEPAKQAKHKAAVEELAKAKKSGAYKYSGIGSVETLKGEMTLPKTRRSRKSD